MDKKSNYTGKIVRFFTGLFSDTTARKKNAAASSRFRGVFNCCVCLCENTIPFSLLKEST